MWKRASGAVAMLLAVTGLFLSVAGLLGAWYARSVASAEIARIAGRVDMALGEADAAFARAASEVLPLREQIGAVLREVEAQTGSVGRPAQALAAARQFDADVIAEYTKLRDAYAEVRLRTTAAIEGIELARRFLPAAMVPEVPVDELAAADERLQALDARLREARLTLVGGADAAAQAAAQLNDAVQQVRALDARAQQVKVAIVEARARLPEAEARLQWWVTLAAILATVICLWSIVLHVSLFGWGRRWWSTAEAAAPGRLATERR